MAPRNEFQPSRPAAAVENLQDLSTMQSETGARLWQTFARSCAMRFPPPIRITAPLLALAVGLAATFFEYRLNLDLDLARHLAEVRQRASSSGHRLAVLSEYLLPRDESDALQADLEGMTQLPQLEIAAVVDDKGRIIADSTGA